MSSVKCWCGRITRIESGGDRPLAATPGWDEDGRVCPVHREQWRETDRGYEPHRHDS